MDTILSLVNTMDAKRFSPKNNKETKRERMKKAKSKRETIIIRILIARTELTKICCPNPSICLTNLIGKNRGIVLSTWQKCVFYSNECSRSEKKKLSAQALIRIWRADKTGLSTVQRSDFPVSSVSNQTKSRKTTPSHYQVKYHFANEIIIWFRKIHY